MLRGQVAKASAIRTFARNLAAFSGTLAGSDDDLRGVIDGGSVAANELRTFIEDNEVELGELINNLVTTGEVTVQHLDGIEQVLVLYPYVVEGGFTVVSKSKDTGLYDAHFGLITQQEPPVCTRGYESTDTRAARGRQQRADERRRPLPGARRPEQRPRHPERTAARTRPPTTPRSRRTTTRAQASWRGVTRPRAAWRTAGTLAPTTFGEESWKWLFLQPLATPPE